MSRDELDDSPSPYAAPSDPDGAEQRDLTGRARTAVLWVGSTTLVWQICSWGLTLLTARVLLPSDYGILSLTETISPFLAMLAGLNLTTWIMQTETLRARDKAAMYSLTTLVGGIMALVGISIAPLAGLFFENDEMVLPLQIVSLTFVLRGTAVVPLASLQRELNFKPVALMRSSVGIATGVLQLALAMLGYGYWSLIVGIVAREVVSAAWAHYYVGLPRDLSWDSRLYRRAIGFGAPATLALVAEILFNASDKVVVGKLFEVEFLGYYSMAFFLTDLPLARINGILRPVFIPYFARLQSTPEKLKQHFSRFVLAITSLIFPLLLGAAVVAEDLVGLVLGAKWLPMARPLQILCIVGLMRSYTDNIPFILLAAGKPMQVLRVRLVYLAVMPLAFFVLASTYGIAGIYLTWLLVFPTCSIVLVLALHEEIGITPWDYVSNLAGPALSSLFMAACVYVAAAPLREQLSAATLVACQVAIGMASYGGFYWLVFRRDAMGVLGALRGRS